MITKAIKRAYDLINTRSDDSIFWAIDLHGCVLKSNYHKSGYEFISDEAKQMLLSINKCPLSYIILYSSCYDEEKNDIIEFFISNGITVHYFNENPLCENTLYGCFDEKFYFSILLDDKAGFDYVEDCKLIIDFLKNIGYEKLEGNKWKITYYNIQ